MTTVAVSALTRVVNLLGALPSKTCSYGTSTTPLNQLGWIVCHKMVPLKFTTINLPSAPALSSTAPASLQSSGLWPSSTQSTFTIDWFMPTPKSLPLKGILALNQISPILKCSARGCASSAVETEAGNWIDFTDIFLGLTAKDHNISYVDLDSGIVKHSHHAIFDEAWYLQPNQPPAA